MECMYCKGKMVKGAAPFNVDRKGYHIHWEAVDAWVCTQCGEAYFEIEAVTHIQEALRILDKETDQIAHSSLVPAAVL
ncbi:MAG: YgiT-type zinc finger protein [Anaerolineae bacterium]|nr:YgiT-type zinc finger protein [Anaerolineae bacterium]